MVKKIGIIGAMEEEIRLLLQSMDSIKKTTYHSFDFYEGVLSGNTVVLCQSGIGKVNASICVSLMKVLFDVDLLINTGTAGGVDPGLTVGDLVIGQSLVHHDVDVTAFDYEFGQMAGMPIAYYSDGLLLQKAKEAADTLQMRAVVGQIASGDQFVSHAQSIDQIKAKFPHVRAVEMESAAIAQASYVLDVPFVIIRAISDNGDQEAAFSFDEFLIQAGARSAQLVKALLLQINYEI